MMMRELSGRNISFVSSAPSSNSATLLTTPVNVLSLLAAPRHNGATAQSFDVTCKLLFRNSRGVLSKLLFGDVIDWPNVELPEVRNPRVDLLARCADDTLRLGNLWDGIETLAAILRRP